jgi:magnesium chelatase accessory protein
MSDRRAGLKDWPNRESSRFVRAGGFSWHVQVMGAGPPLLLLHGTAGATHSWRALAPLLADRFTVVAPDLPGHGFTETPSGARMSLPGMAAGVRSLLQVLEIGPALVAGHSAGAAVALRMVLDGMIAPAGVVALNGALQPMAGMAGQLFSPLAKLLVGLPMLPSLFAWRARSAGVVENLLTGTGSVIDPQGVALYARLIQDPRHAAAALAMMARWDLKPLVADLPRLRTPLLLIAGENDRAIPPSVADDVARLASGARVVRMPGLGHLSHEEDPAGTAALIDGFAVETGVA